MPDDDVMSRVIRVIAETQRVPLETIKPESTFEELKIDSLDGINIPDDAAKSLRSVSDVAAGVEKLIGEK